MSQNIDFGLDMRCGVVCVCGVSVCVVLCGLVWCGVWLVCVLCGVVWCGVWLDCVRCGVCGVVSGISLFGSKPNAIEQ